MFSGYVYILNLLKLIENRLAVVKGTDVAEDFFSESDGFFYMLADAVGGVRIGAYGYDFSAKLAVSFYKFIRGKKHAERVFSACIYFDTLVLFDERFENFIADFLVIAVFKQVPPLTRM